MENITIKDLRNILTFANDNGIDAKEILENIKNEVEDFEVDYYRFIHTGSIDSIQVNELSSDLYILGCFNASFLAGIIDIDIEAIEAIQKAEAYEALGKIAIKHIEEIQQEYSSLDGYGHHFAHYDGHELNDLEYLGYLVFRVN